MLHWCLKVVYVSIYFCCGWYSLLDWLTIEMVLALHPNQSFSPPPPFFFFKKSLCDKYVPWSETWWCILLASCLLYYVISYEREESNKMGFKKSLWYDAPIILRHDPKYILRELCYPDIFCVMTKMSNTMSLPTCLPKYACKWTSNLS